MNKKNGIWMLFVIVAIGALALVLLAGCAPEGSWTSPLATPNVALTQTIYPPWIPRPVEDVRKLTPRPATLIPYDTPRPITLEPVSPLPTPTLLPDKGVRLSSPAQVALDVNVQTLQGKLGYVASVAVDGNTMAMAIDYGGAISIATFDFETQRTRVLTTEMGTYSRGLHVSGRWVVWELPGSKTSSDVLYAYNLQTGQTSRIAEGDHADLAGNMVVWQQFGNSWDIWGYDLIQNKTFPIVVRPGSQTEPLASGRWVVYMDGANKDNVGNELRAINLDTSEDIRLGEVYIPPKIYVPPRYAIDMPWVAWGTGRESATPELHLYNLDSHMAYTVTVTSCASPGQFGSLGYLALSRNTVIFRGCYQDMGYDIKQGVFFSLPTYTPEMQGGGWSGWAISGDRLVWRRSFDSSDKKESRIYTAQIQRGP